MLKKSRKKFLFGRVYTVVNTPEEIKDKTFITEETMNNIYKSKSIFEINKNNYLTSLIYHLYLYVLLLPFQNLYLNLFEALLHSYLK